MEKKLISFKVDIIKGYFGYLKREKIYQRDNKRIFVFNKILVQFCYLIKFQLNFFFQSLPQTPAGGVGGKGGGGSGVPGSGMVNGAGADHQDIRDGAAINTEHVSTLIII